MIRFEIVPALFSGPGANALRTCSFRIAFDGRVIAKEPQYFPGRIRPSRIGVGTGGTSTRPRMASSMDAPLLQDCLPVRIGMDRAGVRMATRYFPAMHSLLQISASRSTGDDMIGVSGVYYGVTISVENDGRDKLLLVFRKVRSFTGRVRAS